MPYVFSTLSSDQVYVQWGDAPAQGGLPVRRAQVLIAGGANVANERFVTPQGVATQVTAEQLEILNGIKAFQDHVKANHIKVSKSKADADEVAQDMKPKDESAPLTEPDYAPGEAPKIGAPSDEDDAPAAPTRGRRGR